MELAYPQVIARVALKAAAAAQVADFAELVGPHVGIDVPEAVGRLDVGVLAFKGLRPTDFGIQYASLTERPPGAPPSKGVFKPIEFGARHRDLKAQNLSYGSKLRGPAGGRQPEAVGLSNSQKFVPPGPVSAAPNDLGIA